MFFVGCSWYFVVFFVFPQAFLVCFVVFLSFSLHLGRSKMLSYVFPCSVVRSSAAQPVHIATPRPGDPELQEERQSMSKTSRLSARPEAETVAGVDIEKN